MRITEIREMEVPLAGDLANAVVSFRGHKVSLVAVFTDLIRGGRPVVGIGFNSIGRHAQGGILRDRMIPRVLAAAPADLLGPPSGLIDPGRVVGAAMSGEKPGGHGDRAGAAAAIELACWDLLAKLNEEPASETIARAFGRAPLVGGVPVYAAGGYYHDQGGPDRLRCELAGYLETGYQAVKIKIGGAPLAEDMERIEIAIDVVGSGTNLAVDANGRFDLPSALAYAEALEPYGLRWLEEPGDPLDFALSASVAAAYPGALATGENLFSHQDVRNLARYGGLRPGLDIFQMDAGLSYGVGEYVRMLEVMEDDGFFRSNAFPHGGHLLNLHIVTALGLGGCESYPGVFAPFGGYGDACPLEEGRIRVADAPGFGLETKSELRPLIAELVA